MTCTLLRLSSDPPAKPPHSLPTRDFLSPRCDGQEQHPFTSTLQLRDLYTTHGVRTWSPPHQTRGAHTWRDSTGHALYILYHGSLPPSGGNALEGHPPSWVKILEGYPLYPPTLLFAAVWGMFLSTAAAVHLLADYCF